MLLMGYVCHFYPSFIHFHPFKSSEHERTDSTSERKAQPRRSARTWQTMTVACKPQTRPRSDRAAKRGDMNWLFPSRKQLQAQQAVVQPASSTPGVPMALSTLGARHPASRRRSHHSIFTSTYLYYSSSSAERSWRRQRQTVQVCLHSPSASYQGLADPFLLSGRPRSSLEANGLTGPNSTGRLRGQSWPRVRGAPGAAGQDQQSRWAAGTDQAIL